jgi:flagellar biosynthesis/type III secretory pathway ATPase
MPAVASEAHKKAALKIREIYATYTDAEDLIQIGAFAPGSNRRIDGSIALIDRIRRFLIQPPRQRCPFDQTLQQMNEIADAWEQLLSDRPAASAEKMNAKPKLRLNPASSGASK